MDSSTTPREVSHNILPYLLQFTDGTVERIAGTQQTPPGTDLLTGVISKDILLIPETDLSARLYHPNNVSPNEKLPLVIYFHGGAFLIATPAEPLYHRFCNALAASARALVVSVDYRLAPEQPLPAAFHDAWAAIQWAAAHACGNGHEAWLNDGVDFGRVFLVGDSAGATLAHHAVCRVESSSEIRIQGIAHIHPYFWGKDPLRAELTYPVRKAMVDKWWEYVCPSDKGCDDPLINPFSDGAPSLDRVDCERMLVMVAEKDILRERGKLYYDAMVKRKNVEYFETEGEDHVFHIFNPQCDKAKELISKLASFINGQDQSENEYIISVV